MLRMENPPSVREVDVLTWHGPTPTRQEVSLASSSQQWLASVRNHQSAHRVDLTTAARQNRLSFPRSWLVVIIGQLFKGIVKWIVKTALRDAAADFGINLTQAELDVLAALAVDALLAA
jgi:hypothetical protein